MEESIEIPTLLTNDDFITELRWILDKFGMNARLSKLVDRTSFCKGIEESIPFFDDIIKHVTSITNLKLTDSNEAKNLYTLICDLYNLFSAPRKLSYSGGFVIASKSMHFILPELFIMIDGSHIGISLYNIEDYKPNFKDGRNWIDVIPNFSGKRPNPSPRGMGRKSWDSERYCIALMYFKRIYQEWVRSNNSNYESFLKLDIYSNSVPRIIDKSLW